MNSPLLAEREHSPNKKGEKVPKAGVRSKETKQIYLIHFPKGLSMKKEVIVLIAEDDDGHAILIERNLRRAGLLNEIVRFKDGQETLDFLFGKSKGPKCKPDTAYMLLLDIRMPKADGVDVLRQVKADKDLKKLPIIMITTTDDPREVELCHELGCSNYITKPIDYDKFVEAVRQLGLFLLVVEVPKINGNGK